MQLNGIVLLLAATLLALVNTTSTDSEVRLTASDFPARDFADKEHKRLLRTIETEDEDRTVSIPGLSKLKNLFATKGSKLKSWYTDRTQLKGWMKDKNTPDEVFKLLNLDEGVETLMASPKLILWTKYLKIYNKKNPDKRVYMLGVFTKTYRDEAVAKMLEAARRNPATRTLANQLQTQQLAGWAQNGLHPDVVFQMLKIGNDGVEKLLGNPALNVWFYYFNQMNRHNADREVNLIKTLLKSYDDIPLAKAIEAAKKMDTTVFMGKQLQNAQFRKWLSDGIDPPTILKSLKMDKVKWDLDSNAEIFRGYTTFYNANKQ